MVGLLSALVSTNQQAAVSNLVENSTGLSIQVPNPTDPVEREFSKLLEEDNSAQAEVDKWIKESHSNTNSSSATLTLRINQRFEPVKKGYKDFLERNPKHVGAHLAFGSFLNEIRDEEEGVKHWEKARELDPKNPAGWNNLANYYGHRGPVKTAFEYYAKAIELNPNEPVYRWNFATTVYLFRKDAMEFYGVDEPKVFDKALELYRQAMRLSPNDFILASDYAQSFYGTKPPRLKEGLIAWNDAMKIARDDVEREGVRIHLARINWKLGNLGEARQQLNLITNEMYFSTKKKIMENVAESEKNIKETNAIPAAAVEKVP